MCILKKLILGKEKRIGENQSFFVTSALKYSFLRDLFTDEGLKTLSSTEFIEIKEGLAESDKVILSAFTGVMEEGMPVTDMSAIMTDVEEP